MGVEASRIPPGTGKRAPLSGAHRVRDQPSVPGIRTPLVPLPFRSEVHVRSPGMLSSTGVVRRCGSAVETNGEKEPKEAMADEEGFVPWMVTVSIAVRSMRTNVIVLRSSTETRAFACRTCTKMRARGAVRCRVRASSSAPSRARGDVSSLPAPTRARSDASTSMPVFVMLPLDTVRLCAEGEDQAPTLQRPKALEVAMKALRMAGVRGVMVDVWWGFVEARPNTYRWEAYAELFSMAERVGLTVQPVMSFHACGNNVNDDYGVSLPKWVTEIGKENPDIYFTDQRGHRNQECLSLGCDEIPILHGRTPVQVYEDFIEAFCYKFGPLLGNVIPEITVGLGPAGELRYPSYPEGDGRWRFPGIGEFQCYDKYMLEALEREADRAGRSEWGQGGPHDAGYYNSRPWETGFFHPTHGRFASEYGDFFLNFYSSQLIAHADRVLAAASKVVTKFNARCQRFKEEDSDVTIYSFGDEEYNLELGVKLAGVHWWYNSRSHAAELTAGYYNTQDHEGYDAVMKVLKKHNAILNFTCVEMNDYEHPPESQCSPEGLFCQVAQAAGKNGVALAGENALPRYDAAAWNRIEANAFHDLPGAPGIDSCNAVGCTNRTRLAKLTWLRMEDSMFDGPNWDAFTRSIGRFSSYGAAA